MIDRSGKCHIMARQLCRRGIIAGRSVCWLIRGPRADLLRRLAAKRFETFAHGKLRTAVALYSRGISPFDLPTLILSVVLQNDERRILAGNRIALAEPHDFVNRTRVSSTTAVGHQSLDSMLRPHPLDLGIGFVVIDYRLKPARVADRGGGER